jgi:hypothetical protein
MLKKVKVMKSNKQRRAEIRQKRLERAEAIEEKIRELEAGGFDPRALRLAGLEPAHLGTLAGYDAAPHGLRPRYYVDRPFRCCDCGAQEVWTAKQQKWWYEKMGGNLNSTAVRCLSCRRAHRAQRQASQAGEGADLLGEQTRRLRALGDLKRPNEAARAEVNAALQSKWSSLREVARQTMERWGHQNESKP